MLAICVVPRGGALSGGARRGCDVAGQLAAGDDVDVDADALWPVECMGGPGWPQVPWWHNIGMAGLTAAGRVGSAAAVPGLIWAVEVV
jgi:hypothetical protein